MNVRALPLLLSLLAATCAYTAGYVGNEDLGWYLASGKEILREGRIPDRDPFLYTSADRAAPQVGPDAPRGWVTHSWLWTVLLARLDLGFGLEGVAVFSTLCVSALVVLIFCAARVDPLGLANAAFTTLALAGAASRFTPRSDVASCLLLVVFLTALERSRPLRWRTVALLAALQWLWSNLHGGYPLGIFAGFAYGLGDWYEGRHADRAHSRPAPLLALGPVLALVSLATPSLRRELAVFTLVRELGFTSAGGQSPLIEWQRTWAQLDANALLYAALLALGAASFAVRRGPPRVARAVVFAGSALLALFAIRFVSVFALVTAWVSLLHLGELRPEVAQRLERLRRPWLRATYAVGAALFCALLLAIATSLWTSRDALDGDAPRRAFAALRPEFSAPGAAAWIREHELPAPVFNEIVLGGYLVDALYPAYQLFIDTRNLSTPLLDTYRNAVAGPQAWRALLARYGFRTVVLSNLSFEPMRLRRMLARDPAWRLVFVDPQAAVFVRAGEPSPPRELHPFGRWGPGQAPFLPASAPGPQRWLGRYGMSLLQEYLRALADLDLSEALEQVASAGLAARPGDAGLLAYRGYARLRLGRPVEAAQDYAELVERAPRDVAARINLARALARSGRRDEAREQLAAAARLDPAHPALPRLRAQLEARGAPAPATPRSAP